MDAQGGEIIDLQTTYLSLDGKGRIATHPANDFWQTIGSNTSLLPTLIVTSESKADWPHWEMHPEGEEIIILLEGAMTMVLDRGDTEEKFALEPGKTFIVPRSVFHRALVARPSKFIGITCGAGTEHRPLKED